jgi:CRISPR-associated protein Csx10
MKTGSPPKLPKLLKFNVTLTMTSDWHIGTGAGRPGDVDSLVQRDINGLPYIPAKTLTGIWRDACEIVALGLDNGTTSAWSAWVNYLFGSQPAYPNAPPDLSPIPAALSVRAAVFPEAIRQGIATKPRLQEALTFIKPGVKIDNATGCAQAECLRFVEMARLGTTLTAPCELGLTHLSPVQQQTACALLFASTRIVERIGGNRRRGSGRCQMQVEGKDLETVDSWVNWLDNHTDIPTPPQIELSAAKSAASELSGSSSSGWQIIPLTIQTHTPLTIAKCTIGNVVETLDYIPGTHLLGVILSKLRKHLNIDLNQAIANTQLIVTNGTLTVNAKPGRPVPHALFGEKSTGGLEQGGTVYNTLVEPSDPDQPQLKGERQGYIGSSITGALPTLAKVKKTVETHNTIEDGPQRPTSDVGGVYSYTAIQPNLEFRAELRLSAALVDQLNKKNRSWWECLNGSARLGQSKKDDYGAVTLKVSKPNVHKPMPPTPTNKGDQGGNPQLTVWLLSDVLLRDERLRPTADIQALAKAIGEQLKVTLTPREDAPLVSIMARSHRIDSWQVRWGLPRPSLVGLSAGSCFVFTLSAIPDANLLAQLEITGIGERRCEGFGQLCFNAPLLLHPTSNLQKPPAENKERSSANAAPLIGKSKHQSVSNYAHTLELAAWRTAIQRAALSIAANPQKRENILGTSKISNQPSMSQLGGLRSLVNRLNQPSDASIQGWFGQSDGDDLAKDKWKRRQEKWGGNLEKIYTFVTQKDEIWQVLNIDGAELSLTQIDSQSELWAEALQIIIDACIRAHKRELETKSALED